MENIVNSGSVILHISLGLWTHLWKHPCHSESESVLSSWASSYRITEISQVSAWGQPCLWRKSSCKDFSGNPSLKTNKPTQPKGWGKAPSFSFTLQVDEGKGFWGCQNHRNRQCFCSLVTTPVIALWKCGCSWRPWTTFLWQCHHT